MQSNKGQKRSIGSLLSLILVLAEKPCLARREFTPEILRIRSVPDDSGTFFIPVHQRIEKTQQITRQARLELEIMIGTSGNNIRVRSIIQRSSEAEVEMVLIRIPHERISCKRRIEVRVDIE